jgi:hypothetical protein
VPKLQRLLRRLTASEHQLEAEQLQEDATRSGCVLANGVARGERVKLTGRLRTVVYTPRTNVPTLEAELYDGSGTVTLVWLGRRRILGIEPGQPLTVQGRVALRDGRCVIYNPHYELHV